MCSSNESGTPAGAPGSSRTAPLSLRASMRAIRDSISRMFSGVLIQTLTVSRSQRPPQGRHLHRPHLQDAAIGRAPAGPLLRRSARPKQELEETHTRIPHHGQRLLRGGPTDRVGIDARITVGAPAGLIDRFDAQLQRGNRRVLAAVLDVQLVHRRTDADVGPLRQLRMRVRVHHRARSEMVATDFIREAPSLPPSSRRCC